jgi:hypothetical protein
MIKKVLQPLRLAIYFDIKETVIAEKLLLGGKTPLGVFIFTAQQAMRVIATRQELSEEEEYFEDMLYSELLRYPSDTEITFHFTK